MISRGLFGASILAFSIASLSVYPAYASGTSLPLQLAPSGQVKLDGMLSEWSGLSALTGREGSPTASMRGGLAYDDTYLYVAGEVRDPTFVRTAGFKTNEDHAELVITFPEADGSYRTVYELQLFAGDPGQTAGLVKAAALGVVGSAKLIEAPTKDGYTFEARVPWSLFPAAADTRVALRAALRYRDASRGGPAGVLSTATKGPAGELPLAPMAAEQSLSRGLLQQKGIIAPPSHDLVVNVAGDAMKERVLLYDSYLVVLGPRFRDGNQYFWNDLGVDVQRGELLMFQVQDMNGDGKHEIIVQKRLRVGEGWREILQVLAFNAAGRLEPVFDQETGLSSSIGTIRNEVELMPEGRGRAIKISVGTVAGYTSSNYREPTETEREPLLLPWGTVRSRTFVWDATGFKKTSEESKPADAIAQAEQAPPAPERPRPPTADELLDQVFGLYKRDHNIPAGVRPNFDFVTNVGEDERPERIVCHGRDLVVFGKGFREGRGYVSLSMSQFAGPADIVDVTARDLTGDGRADVLVRGLMRVPAPEELGEGEVQREVLFVYSVLPRGITRVFATETGLRHGDKRLHATVAFLAGTPGLDIEVRPARATGWDRTTWPWRQDNEAVSGIMPLVLPWTTQPLRYRFDGSSYAR